MFKSLNGIKEEKQNAVANNSVITPIKKKAAAPQPEVHNEVAVTIEQPEEVVIVKPQPRQKVKVQVEERDHKSLEAFRRPGLSDAQFFPDPKSVNMKIWNKEVRNFLRHFSEENQDNGGNPIYAYNIMELCVEIMMYDLKLIPYNENTKRGFLDVQELREYLQQKLANRTNN